MSAATLAVIYAGIEALGWTLLHFLWQGALAGAVFALLMKICARGSARLRYAIGVNALAVLALTPILTFWMLFDPPGATVAGLAAAAQLPPFAAAAANVAWWTDARQIVEHLLPWLVLAWLIGVALLSWRLGRDWAEVRALVNSSTSALPERWLATTERLRMAFGIRRPVRALESALVRVPMVVGWIKPVILIPPAALLGLTAQQLELLVAHELAHIRRFDHAVNLCQIVVETLLFYHPVVRRISARIREERELCCDDLVVASSGEKLAYARALAEMEGLRSMAPRMSLAADGGQLVSRINRLVALPAPQRGTAHWLLGFLLVATGVVVTTATRFTLVGLDAPAPAASPVIAAARIEASAPDRAFIDASAAAPSPAAAEAPAPIRAAAAPAAVTGSATHAAAPAARQAARPESTAPVAQAKAAEPMSAPQSDERPQMRALPAAVEQPADAASPAVSAPPVDAASPAATAPRVEAATPAPTAPSQPQPQVMAKPVGETAVPADEAAEVKTGSTAQDAGSAVPSLRLARIDARTEIARAAASSGAGLSEPDSEAPLASAAATPVEDGLSGGTPLLVTQPDFPRRARVKGIEGAVTVEFTVTDTGRVSDPRIVAAEPRGTFDRAVLKTVEDWRFEPFRRNGAPVEQNLTRTIEFRLDGLAKTPAQPACVTMTGSRLCRNVRLGPAERDVEILQRAGSGRGLGVR